MEHSKHFLFWVIVVIGKPKCQVRKASYCDSKQQ